MFTIVTHSGNFHADDVFAVATLQLRLGVENVRVVRSREAADIASADWVVDVGGEYDPAHQRFDHHQNGAPVRENGIPYAAFGLVWKELGEVVTGSPEVAQSIEEYLVQPIDAGDNAVTLYTLNEYQVKPFELFSVISSFRPVWGSETEVHETFMQAVEFARELLVRQIAHGKAGVVREQLVAATYEAAPDKRLIMTAEDVSVRAFAKYPEVMVVVAPDDKALPTKWVAGAVPVTADSFVSRVLFPAGWAGLAGAELVAVSGIKDAQFCHKSRHLFVAGSQEGAVAAGKKALESSGSVTNH